jgi:hypothetical protein
MNNFTRGTQTLDPFPVAGKCNVCQLSFPDPEAVRDSQICGSDCSHLLGVRSSTKAAIPHSENGVQPDAFSSVTIA